MESYRNDVEKDYKICGKIETLIKVVYLINIILSAIVLIYESDYILGTLIVLQVMYFGVTIFNDLILFNYAESERLKTAIEYSYCVDMTPKKTKGYYNNDEKTGIKKLGVTSFESLVHTKNNCKLMLIPETIKFVIEIMLWIVIILVFKEKSIILCLTQTIFSSELLYNYLKFIYFYNKVNLLYEKNYEVFISKKYNKSAEPFVIEYYVEYESLKRYCHILLSSSNFKNNNDEWSKEWLELKNKIK